MRAAALLLLLANVIGYAQTSALMPTAEAGRAARRAAQLMEAAMVANFALGKTGAPLLEDARKFAAQFEKGQMTTPAVYSFLEDLRAFLALSDAAPKPYPFPETSRAQLHELRDAEDRFDAHFRAMCEQREAQARPADRDNVARYAEQNRLEAKQTGQGPRVVFYGDSITDFWRLNEYFPGKDFLNRGISGQVTGQMLGRMKTDVLDLKPAAVLLLAGTNDIARGTPLPIIENNISMIADLAAAHNIKLIVASVLPVHSYNSKSDQVALRPPQQISALNAWIQNFCKADRCYYLDYYSSMLDASGRLKQDLADDGLHPNSAGYRIMAPLAAAAIDSAVSATPPQQNKKKRRLSF